MVVIFLPLNAVCALLTTFEFIIATLVIFSFRPVIHGFWLFKLHRRKMLQLHVLEKPYQGIALEAVGLLIGAWFALFVTLTEYRLEEGVFPSSSQPEMSSSYCAFMNTTCHQQDMEDARSPSQFFIDSMSLDIVEQHPCPHGIDYLDFGTVLDNSENEESALIPKCVPQARAIAPADIPELTFKVQSQYDMSFHMSTNLPFILPYSMPSFGVSLRGGSNFSISPTPPIAECAARNISSVSSDPDFWWSTREVDVYNVSRALLQRLCVSLDEIIVPMNATFLNASNCRPDYYYVVNTKCLRTYMASKTAINKPSTHSMTFKDVSVLVVEQNYGKNTLNPETVSMACVNASVSYEYVLLSNSAARLIDMERKELSKPQYFVFPLLVRVLSGSCERTIPALGLSALLYSTKTEWPTINSMQLDDRLQRLSRQQRFHAFMLSIARYEFPFEELRIRDNFARDCTFEVMISGTKVSTDAVFVLLVLSLSACSTVTVMAAFFILFIPRHAWEVANFVQKVITDDISIFALHQGTEGEKKKENASESDCGEEAVVHVTFKRRPRGMWYEKQAAIDQSKISSIVVTVEREIAPDTKTDDTPGHRRDGMFGHSTFYRVKCFSGPPI